MKTTKPFAVSKKSVFEAYNKVRQNAGGAGIDEQSIQDFERNLENNLYKI